MDAKKTYAVFVSLFVSFHCSKSGDIARGENRNAPVRFDSLCVDGDLSLMDKPLTHNIRACSQDGAGTNGIEVLINEMIYIWAGTKKSREKQCKIGTKFNDGPNNFVDIEKKLLQISGFSGFIVTEPKRELKLMVKLISATTPPGWVEFEQIPLLPGQYLRIQRYEDGKIVQVSTAFCQ
ncbi:MAG: hypothetical protein U0519_03220 [Candidatus Gracilibacteria bacterium]